MLSSRPSLHHMKDTRQFADRFSARLWTRIVSPSVFERSLVSFSVADTDEGATLSAFLFSDSFCHELSESVDKILLDSRNWFASFSQAIFQRDKSQVHSVELPSTVISLSLGIVLVLILLTASSNSNDPGCSVIIPWFLDTTWRAATSITNAS